MDIGVFAYRLKLFRYIAYRKCANYLLKTHKYTKNKPFYAYFVHIRAFLCIFMQIQNEPMDRLFTSNTTLANGVSVYIGYYPLYRKLAPKGKNELENGRSYIAPFRLYSYRHNHPHSCVYLTQVIDHAINASGQGAQVKEP